MSLVTDFLNLIKPEAAEKWSRTQYNQNLDKIDKGFKDGLQIVSKKSTYDVGVVDGRDSTFLRISNGQNVGIIVANIRLNTKDTFNVLIPNRNSAGYEWNPALIPPDMRPSSSVGLYAGGLISGSGFGSELQVGVTGEGRFQTRTNGDEIRLQGAGKVVTAELVYPWNGALS